MENYFCFVLSSYDYASLLTNGRLVTPAAAAGIQHLPPNKGKKKLQTCCIPVGGRPGAGSISIRIT